MTLNQPNTKKEAQIIIKSLAHQELITFFPYDFEFDDNYKPDWGTYDGFGRMDPIMTYKRTTRDISISFNVVAENANMASVNFQNLQKLIKCLYPTYQRPPSGFQDSIENLEKNRLDKLQQAAAAEAAAESLPSASPTLDANIEANTEANSEVAKIEAELLGTYERQREESQVISDFGISIMHKSPLFQISFMNLIKSEDHVAAITNFKHKLKFDSADTSFINGIAIPGEFNVNITFKVLHTYVPGNKLNY